MYFPIRLLNNAYFTGVFKGTVLPFHTIFKLGEALRILGLASKSAKASCTSMFLSAHLFLVSCVMVGGCDEESRAFKYFPSVLKVSE